MTKINNRHPSNFNIKFFDGSVPDSMVVHFYCECGQQDGRFWRPEELAALPDALVIVCPRCARWSPMLKKDILKAQDILIKRRVQK